MNKGTPKTSYAQMWNYIRKMNHELSPKFEFVIKPPKGANLTLVRNLIDTLWASKAEIITEEAVAALAPYMTTSEVKYTAISYQDFLDWQEDLKKAVEEKVKLELAQKEAAEKAQAESLKKTLKEIK